MTSYILDASIAAAWFLPARDEPLSAPAIQIQYEYAAGKIQLHAPDLILPELGNVLHKAILRGRISTVSAGLAIEKFLGFDIPVVPSRPLLKLAVSISEARGGSVYDSMYVALAATARRPLLTADQRLVNRMGGYYPVYWLGAI